MHNIQYHNFKYPILTHPRLKPKVTRVYLIYLVHKEKKIEILSNSKEIHMFRTLKHRWC